MRARRFKERTHVVTGTVVEVYDLKRPGLTCLGYRAQIDGTDIKAEVHQPGMGPKAAIDEVTALFRHKFGVKACGVRRGSTKFFYIRYLNTQFSHNHQRDNDRRN